jgi:hypothetical protein
MVSRHRTLRAEPLEARNMLAADPIAADDLVISASQSQYLEGQTVAGVFEWDRKAPAPFNFGYEVTAPGVAPGQ